VKGKNQFSELEFEMLKKLTSEKVKASPDKQKGIRNRIRKLGFYYSDFNNQKNGYDLKDLQQLVNNGQITVKGQNKLTKPKISELIKKTKPQKTEPEINNFEDLSQILDKFLANRFDPIIDHETKIANSSGNYIICKRKTAIIPNFSSEIEFEKFDKLEVIYTGIAGKSLKTRDFRQHFKGNNAGRSTLRKSLGVLFGYKLIPRDKDPNTGKTKFCIEDEIKLSDWMQKNLIMYFLPNSDFNNLENKLIEYFNPPLNLSKNKSFINLDFRKRLSELRNKTELKY
jgi:hypothetical protein